MPQIQAAKKALRSDKRKRAINDRWRRQLRDALKAVRSAFTTGDKKSATEAVKNAGSMLDKAAKHNIIHRNKANRQKSRLAKQITSL